MKRGAPCVAGEEAIATIFFTATSNPSSCSDSKSRTDDDAVDRREQQMEDDAVNQSKKRWSEADGEDGGRGAELHRSPSKAAAAMPIETQQ